MSWYKQSQLNYPIEDPPLYGHSDYKDHGGKIIQMSPEDFLRKAPGLTVDEVSQENIDELKDMILNDRKIDPLNLYLENGEVVDHDGRHRAVAAQQLGITSVPVLILEKGL
jgi:ParB-like chromosome segregation protein Spo0J